MPLGSSSRAVFLDRDGVINRCDVRNGKPYAPRELAAFRLLPGAAAAVRALKSAGFLVIVITNQPDIGNGLVRAEVVDAMHQKLRRDMPVDDIKICPHSQTSGCACRKPKPGMLLDAAREWRIDLKESVMIGDRWSDIIAGQAAHCYTILVDRGYQEPQLVTPDKYTKSLGTAARWVLSRV